MIEALMVVAQLATIDCQERHPGDTRPAGWAWRTVDGKQCWYQGAPMRPKHLLRWPEPAEPEFMRPREEPEMILQQEPAQEHRWPVYGRGK